MSQLKAGVGASDTLFQHDRPNKPNRSRFNISRITNYTADPGMIIPFDWFFCLPGDDVDIDFEYILDTLPLVNPSLTSYKVLTHWYAIDLKHLWEGWQTFITRGRSGNIGLQVPQIQIGYPLAKNFSIKPYNDSSDSVFCDVVSVASHSLSSFLGVPPTFNGIAKGLKSEADGAFHIEKAYLPYSYYNLNGANITVTQSDAYNTLCRTGFNYYDKVSALPFMAYQNIVKYNYVNQNLLQNNHSLFPVKGDHDWFLPYDATTTNWLDFASNDAADAAPDADKVFSLDGVFSDSDTATRLDQLRYAMFDDDYFTTGLPWLQRGDVSSVPVEPGTTTLTIGAQEITVPSQDVPLGSINVGVAHFGDSEFVQLNARFGNNNQVPDDFHAQSSVGSTNVSLPLITNRETVTVGSHSVNIPSQTVTGSVSGLLVSINALREHIAMQVWQERNARVNGSYNAMIFQHWQSNPHGEEHKPHYIGGTADYINFATILQSSESTSDSPLGATAGRGASGGSAKVGHYHANDYSYVFGIMIIKPNTTYMQGIEHHLTEKVFDDFVQPEFEGLSPQPILNKELYVSSNSNDEDLLCYQERYVYLKVRQNVNHGMFQCKPEKDRLFGSFTQARWFESKPTFSYQFLCMSPDNMRRDWLAYPSMPAFKIQAASKVFVTRSLAYTSQPNTFGF